MQSIYFSEKKLLFYILLVVGWGTFTLKFNAEGSPISGTSIKKETSAKEVKKY